MYCIIVENEVSKWDDVTGVKYHFPNKYQKLLLPGTQVVYYKGNISKPYYFGYAVIGDVYLDSDNSKNLYAEILDYIPFPNQVYFKLDNEYLEEPSKSNHFRDGVRKTSNKIFNRVINLSGLEIKSDNLEEPPITYGSAPRIDEVEIELSDLSLIKTKNLKDKKGGAANTTLRYSSNAKKVGDRGEELAIEYLKRVLKVEEFNTLRHHASENEKFGYDISYRSSGGTIIYVEVKATTAALFNNFILTENELRAAQDLGENYHIYLISNCLAKKASLEILKDIASAIKKEKFVNTPISYKIEKTF